MTRTEEQLEAVAELTEVELARFRKLQSASDDAVGIDGVDKSGCFINGWDSCVDLGITRENGFTDSEIQNATDRFTARTAYLFEVI